MSTHNICFHGEIRKILCVWVRGVGVGGGVVGWCEGVMYLRSLGRPADNGLEFGKACYPCSR